MRYALCPGLPIPSTCSTVSSTLLCTELRDRDYLSDASTLQMEEKRNEETVIVRCRKQIYHLREHGTPSSLPYGVRPVCKQILIASQLNKEALCFLCLADYLRPFVAASASVLHAALRSSQHKRSTHYATDFMARNQPPQVSPLRTSRRYTPCSATKATVHDLPSGIDLLTSRAAPLRSTPRANNHDRKNQSLHVSPSQDATGLRLSNPISSRL